MHFIQATETDVQSLVKVYKEGYRKAIDSGVEVWEEPDEEFVRELLPDLYLIQGSEQRYRGGLLGAVKLTYKPNPLVWDEHLNQGNEHVYFSKLVASSAGLGFLSVRRVLELIFLKYKDIVSIRWDILTVNESILNYYCDTIGATKVEERIFHSQKRNEPVSVTKLELTAENLKNHTL